MGDYPLITTERLQLRAFTEVDAKRVQLLAGSHAVAHTTINIPHPYEDGMAEEWIATHQQGYEKGESLVLKIVLQSDAVLIGAIDLVIVSQHQRAEMGYWIGEQYWGQGYCSEAAQALMLFGFRELQLNRIFARHFGRNPASGRVMQKIDMTHEGCLRQHVLKKGQYEDLVVYGMTREEYEQQQAA